ncbi:hypothetical protein [Pandoraea apista]|uniref:hypothetical protein n=1 Tax=Pandoraea apista TaxID=93218 RepID=UPI00058A83A7|nr:hypothetical protein [Pandoraea apista]AJE98911.1 hypothetical protein SG18_13155 [Pandoraea apista]AKH72993.1 hypothetical protein XM39_13350 [Pandoraea apista]AKI61378.1 hypothetical protein AA956_05610 [Pandoraea apista]
MNVGTCHVGPSAASPLNTAALEPTYRSLNWSDVVQIRALNPKCNPTKAAVALAATHPDSVFGREIERYIGKTPIGDPARGAQQRQALRQLAVLENHEVTVDLLRNTGLPDGIALDLLQRLLARPMEWTIFERLVLTPNLNAWARSVLERNEAVHVADDVLTLRILQAFGHDVAVPWSFDVTNKWVYFYSASTSDMGSLKGLLDMAITDRPDDDCVRDACRSAYQALAHTHYRTHEQIWPHWEVRNGLWEIYPDPRGARFLDDIVSHHPVTCETERWLRNVTPVGCLDLPGRPARTGPDYDSDLSDPDNLTGNPAQAAITPSELRERRAASASRQQAARGAPAPPSDAPSQGTGTTSPDEGR